MKVKFFRGEGVVPWTYVYIVPTEIAALSVGYTGHCPKYKSVVGHTYGSATHAVMEKLPMPPGRLKPLPAQPQEDNSQEKDLEIIGKRKTEKENLLSKDIALGYTGHIPRASYQIGLSFTKSCIKGMAEFEKKKTIYEEFLKASGVARGD